MYSQNNEEDILLQYFRNHRGTLLEIGANDGRTFSNSLALIERSWRGVLIEASPKAFERLKEEHKLRESLELVNVAVATYDGEIVLNESGQLLGKGDVALVSSTKAEEMERWKSLDMPFEQIKVPCRKLSTILEKSQYKKFDLLLIDIEGAEVDIMPTIDVKALGIRCAVIEWNGKNKEVFDKVMEGYRLIGKNAENLIYAK